MPATEEAQAVEAKELATFKHKVLVTFSNHICLPIRGTATFVNAAICEFTDADKNYREAVPSRLTVVALPDRPPLPCALRIYLSCTHVAAAVFLDDEDVILSKIGS